MLGTEEGATHWLYLIGILTGLPAFWMCFVVFHWDYASERLASPWPRFLASDSLYAIDVDMLFRQVSILWWLFSTSPFWIMLGVCTNVLDRTT